MCHPPPCHTGKVISDLETPLQEGQLPGPLSPAWHPVPQQGFSQSPGTDLSPWAAAPVFCTAAVSPRLLKPLLLSTRTATALLSAGSYFRLHVHPECLTLLVQQGPFPMPLEQPMPEAALEEMHTLDTAAPQQLRASSAFPPSPHWEVFPVPQKPSGTRSSFAVGKVSGNSPFHRITAHIPLSLARHSCGDTTA